MLEGAPEALGYVLTWKGLFLLAFATAIGSAAAILPGISPPTMMALLLPITFGMDRYEAFMFLAALMAASGFAGSMTSILLNVPGDGINAATCLDGFPLARQGKAGVAIGASATASGLGALFGLVLLVLSLPFIRNLILSFGPPEFFALSLAGVALIATVSTRTPLKGMIAGLFGMTLGFVGVNMTVGGTRYTFGILELQDGIALLPVLIGLFALPELYGLLRRDQSVSLQGFAVKGGVWQGVLEVLRRPVLFFRSAALGTLLGIIPGVGASVASWVSYFAALNSSKNPGSFGKGNIEGVIAPEATIDAKEGASMMPVLALGLPAGVSTAILLSAFQIHGVFPGQRLFQNDMPFIWVLILAMVFSNLLTSMLGLAFANAMVKLTLVPVVLMAPIILVLGAVGSYADQQSMFGITLMIVFGLVGLVMVQFGYPRPPMLVGMILLPLTEQNFHLALQTHRGSYEFLLRPLTLAILTLTALALGWSIFQQVSRRRQARKPLDLSEAPVSAADAIAAEELGEYREVPPSLPALLFPAALLALMLVLLAQSFGFAPRVRMFPQIVLVPLIVLLAYLTARTAIGWWKLRQDGAEVASDDEPGTRPVWWIVAWLLALPLLIWVFGVVTGVGIYTAAFLLGFAPRALSATRALGAVAAGAIMAFSTHYVFVQALGVRFHPGLF